MATLTEQELVALANEKVDIERACQLVNVDALLGTKNYCPFGEIYHADGGRTRSFRLYSDTNSGWCFACSTYFTPVILVSRIRGVPESDAAEFLLESVGYVAPDPESRWAALMDQGLAFDHAAEREALKVFCARIDPGWESRQFDPNFAALLTKCFTPLGKVQNREDLQRWRDTTRSVMSKALTQ